MSQKAKARTSATASKNFDHTFHDTRLGVVERTVWQIVADITALKLEGDGAVPRESLPETEQLRALSAPANMLTFSTRADGDDVPVATFKTKVKPTAARITGVGFFDKVHGQIGVAQLNGIELHPVLKVEFL